MHDLKITGGRVVSVATGEIRESDVLIDGERITAVPGCRSDAPATRTIDAGGSVIAPGFIDAHMHIESSMLTPRTFAEATLPHGTTTVLADPHEIVNVAGSAAMRWMIAEGAGTAQSMFWAVPSCVPSLDDLETAGAALTADDIDELLGLDGVIALGEVMDYRAVVGGGSRMREILDRALRRGVIVDGHCPELAGPELQRYLAAGIDSDHCKNAIPALTEKLRLGMTMMLQEKSLTPEAVAHLLGLPLLPDFCLVTDDVAADAILAQGHLDHLARVARRAGLPPLAVLRGLTIVPARRLRLHDRGVVAPGRRADLVLLEDLDDFRVAEVVVGGVPVPEAVGRGAAPMSTPPFGGSIRLGPISDSGAGSGAEIRPETAVVDAHLEWVVDLPDGEHTFRAIRVNGVDTSTAADAIVLPVRAGRVGWEGRCARVTVIERHEASGRVAHAPVLGMPLSEGAVATTYAHDSHNLTVIGTSVAMMSAAARRVVELDGGIVVHREAGICAEIALPIGGVMTDDPLESVAQATGEIRAALEDWGWKHRIPFMSVSTLTLPVSPALKISDYGLVDVLERRLVPATVG